MFPWLTVLVGLSLLALSFVPVLMLPREESGRVGNRRHRLGLWLIAHDLETTFLLVFLTALTWYLEQGHPLTYVVRIWWPVFAAFGFAALFVLLRLLRNVLRKRADT